MVGTGRLLSGRFTGVVEDRKRVPGETLPFRHRVLVVDDNPGIGESFARLLTSSGYEVRVANSGPVALSLAPEFHPDVILLDLGLPGMDGTEVARRLRKPPISCGALLVAVTGWGGDDDRHRTAEAGFDFHLVKPVDIEVLEPLIGAAVPVVRTDTNLTWRRERVRDGFIKVASRGAIAAARATELRDRSTAFLLGSREIRQRRSAKRAQATGE